VIHLSKSIAAPNPTSSKIAASHTVNDSAIKSLSKAMIESNQLKASAIVKANALSPVQIIDAGLNAVSSSAVNSAVPTILLFSVFTMMKTLTERQQAQRSQ